MALHRRDPPYLGKYIINLKLAKYSRWKLSGWLVGCAKKLKVVQIKPIMGLWLRLYVKRHQKKIPEFGGFLC